MSDLTEAEEHYLKSGGDVTDALLNENKDLPKPETPVVESPPTVPEAPAAAAPEAPASAADDADDEPETPAPAGETQQRERRRVSRKEFDSERAARLAAEKNLQEQAVRFARAEERLNILQEALQQPEQPQGTQRPDPNQDIFAYTQWLEDQLNNVTSKVNGYEEQIRTGQTEMENERRYLSSLNAYAAEKQDFAHAYNYLLRSRAAELTARQYSVTQEQLQGIMDGRVRVPQPVADALRQEERDLYRTAFAQNRDPGATIYQYATMRGYRAPAAAPAPAPAQPAAGTPGTPLGGAPAAPAAQPTPARGGAPTATQVVESIQKGQQAASSLSNAGGTSPDTQLTASALADMSEEQFTKFYEELRAKGQEAVKNIFGH